MRKRGLNAAPRGEMRERVYNYYRWYWNANDKAPTYQQCADALMISNPAVYLHVTSLVREGRLMFDPDRSCRGVRVVAYDLQNKPLEELLSA